MKNYSHAGDVQTVPAPGTLTSGDVFQSGGLIFVATADAASGDDVEACTRGVFSPVPKAAGQAWSTVGALIYWDAELNEFTTTAGDNHLAGTVAAIAESADTVGAVYLDGVARPDETT